VIATNDLVIRNATIVDGTRAPAFICRGEVTYEHAEHTGAMPGRLLRGGRQHRHQETRRLGAVVAVTEGS
jgi:N-acyl-D-aspartate/D-glutamate deacylase